jgi:hypothetical protein
LSGEPRWRDSPDGYSLSVSMPIADKDRRATLDAAPSKRRHSRNVY